MVVGGALACVVLEASWIAWCVDRSSVFSCVELVALVLAASVSLKEFARLAPRVEKKMLLKKCVPPKALQVPSHVPVHRPIFFPSQLRFSLTSIQLLEE